MDLSRDLDRLPVAVIGSLIMTLPDAAKLIGISRFSVNAAVQAGRLPAHLVSGTTYVVLRRDVYAFMVRRKTSAAYRAVDRHVMAVAEAGG